MKLNFLLLLLLIFSTFSCKETTKDAATAETPTTTKNVPPEMESDPIPVSPNLETPELRQEKPTLLDFYASFL